MYIKTYCLGFGLVTALFLATVTGCNKSDPQQKPSASSPPAPGSGLTVARMHWIGKNRLAADSNATNFMAFWNLPESTKLEAQTLDKLSSAPWRLLATAMPLSNAPTALLRPLLDDLVQEESYLEVRGATNQPGELIFAIRLSVERASLWRTNLAAVLESLTGTKASPAPEGWMLKTAATARSSTFNFGLSRAGDWTLFSVAFSPTRPSAPHPLPADGLADFTVRIQRDQSPFATRTTNYWLELHADLAQLVTALQSNSAFNLQPSISANLPHITIAVIGDGANIRTRGELYFSTPLAIELEPWHIPTNLVHDPLIGFMAMRGIRPWLKSLPFWKEASLGTPPNQAFFWAQDGLPALHFFALPSAQASNQVHFLSEFLLNEVNPLIAFTSPNKSFRYGSFERVPDSSLLRWRGFPYIAPNLDLEISGGKTFITGGLYRNNFTNRPAPPELPHQLQITTNLVFYDWENTQAIAQGLIQVSQSGRLVFGRARFSMTNNAALPWLAAIAPKLGIAGTSVRLANANRLTFSRSSTLGLSGVELHLLADWLESPSFPKGFFTLEAKPVPLVPVPAPPPPPNKP